MLAPAHLFPDHAEAGHRTISSRLMFKACVLLRYTGMLKLSFQGASR